MNEAKWAYLKDHAVNEAAIRLRAELAYGREWSKSRGRKYEDLLARAELTEEEKTLARKILEETGKA